MTTGEGFGRQTGPTGAAAEGCAGCLGLVMGLVGLVTGALLFTLAWTYSPLVAIGAISFVVSAVVIFGWTFKEWVKKQRGEAVATRSRPAAFTSLAFFVAAAVLIGVGVAQEESGEEAATGAAASSTPTTFGTPSAQPTEENPLAGPVLGTGELAPFLDLFGPAEEIGVGAIIFWRCPGAGTGGQYTIDDALTPEKFSFIGRTLCSGPMDWETARSESARFYPGDTQEIGEFTADDGSRSFEYHSPALGQALSPGAFNDCAGNSVAPGTFSLVLENTGWVLAVGRCP